MSPRPGSSVGGTRKQASDLLQARKMLSLAREGREVLDKKREALIAELAANAAKVAEQQARVVVLMSAAYRALGAAQLTLGREHLEWAALAANKSLEVEVTPRSVMGVPIATVGAQGEVPELSYGMGNTTVALDEAADRFKQVLEVVPELAESLTTAWRLARELRKTQRRINALEQVFIPDYTGMVTAIQGELEEGEREDLFRFKRTKSKHGPDEM
jgi:V/A-type H+/Na+-transporting ATPase subunit D